MENFDFVTGIKSSILGGGTYGIGAIGLSLIYKYLRFPDFTTIGSMIIGGVATIAVSNTYNIPLGIFSSIIFSCILGFITGLQIAFAKIPGILAGIITGTGALTFSFLLTKDKTGTESALVAFDDRLKPTLDYLIPTTFHWWGLIEIMMILIVVTYAISTFFKTTYGIYTLALLGSEHFLTYRHRKKESTQILLLVLSNGIIGFAGSLSAIHEQTAYSQSHQDFLIVAIGGYSLGNFLIQLFKNKSLRTFLEKEKKPSSVWQFHFIHFLTADLYLNDEEPKKIFITLLFYSSAATIINVVFKSVELVGNIGNYNFIFKAIILLGILLLSNWYNSMAKSISNH